MTTSLPKEYEAVVDASKDIMADVFKGRLSAIYYDKWLTEQLTTLHTKHQEELEKIEKAFGGCTKCYGKGYATTKVWHTGRGLHKEVNQMRFCSCDRGKQLRTLRQEELREAVEKERKNFVYSVLVGICGAPEGERNRFLNTDTNEWRFQGNLGFGGKVHFAKERIRVSTYTESIDENRQAMIDKANQILQTLTNKEI